MFGVAILERKSATYHRAAAARARRLRAEATTRWLKEHLEDTIARPEQIAAQVERVSEPDAVSPHDASAELSSETLELWPVIRGSRRKDDRLPQSERGRLL